MGIIYFLLLDYFLRLNFQKEEYYAKGYTYPNPKCLLQSTLPWVIQACVNFTATLQTSWIVNNILVLNNLMAIKAPH